MKKSLCAVMLSYVVFSAVAAWADIIDPGIYRRLGEAALSFKATEIEVKKVDIPGEKPALHISFSVQGTGLYECALLTKVGGETQVIRAVKAIHDGGGRLQVSEIFPRKRSATESHWDGQKMVEIEKPEEYGLYVAFQPYEYHSRPGPNGSWVSIRYGGYQAVARRILIEKVNDEEQIRVTEEKADDPSIWDYGSLYEFRRQYEAEFRKLEREIRTLKDQYEQLRKVRRTKIKRTRQNSGNASLSQDKMVNGEEPKP